MIDDEDFEWLNKFSWYSSTKLKNGLQYALTRLPNNRKQIKMERMIANLHFGPSKLIVDHKDSNSLNNQKSNNKKAIELYGDKAKLNIIHETT